MKLRNCFATIFCFALSTTVLSSAAEKIAEETIPQSMAGLSASPRAKDGCGLFMTGDVVIWKADQSGLEYALSDADNSEIFMDGTDQVPSFKWKVGFKAGMGYNIPHDEWDIYANYTYCRDRASGHATPPTGGTLYDLLSSESARNEISSASSKFKLRVDIVDLELGKMFHISRFFSLRTHIGLRTDWVHEKHYVTYVGDDFDFGSPDYLYFKNKFWGIGVRTGLDAQLEMGKGWSFYGNGAIALLPGKYRLKITESTTNVVFYTIRDNFLATKCVLDGQIGLKWDHAFSGDKLHLGLHAGWDFHFFINQNQWQYASLNPMPNGDLGLSGFIFGMRFDF